MTLWSIPSQEKWNSNIVGDVQKYYCKSCKKYFHLYPETIEESAGPCPDYDSNQILDWGFYTSRTGNKFKTWRCKNCGKQWRESVI